MQQERFTLSGYFVANQISFWINRTYYVFISFTDCLESDAFYLQSGENALDRLVLSLEHNVVLRS